MHPVGQAVDYGDRAVFRKILHVAVGIGTDHDAVDHAREHARCIGDRLAAAKLNVVG
ncbi:hypothetical protein SDC9_170551 [bioreactor metagenome]|uniref:Uncharacterized protein n=1 Tax=bioreactor metagenome TaxID=1076179 RepID=A0A645GHE9_9ZZZZ